MLELREDDRAGDLDERLVDRLTAGCDLLRLLEFERRGLFTDRDFDLLVLEGRLYAFDLLELLERLLLFTALLRDLPDLVVLRGLYDFPLRVVVLLVFTRV